MNDSDRQTIAEVFAEFERLGIRNQLDYDRLHEYSIITHSTAIEGSTVTFEENEQMFDRGIVPAGKTLHEQMMNLDLKHAYEVARSIALAHTPLTPALLKALAAIVMKNTGSAYSTANGTYDEARGDFRLLNVRAGRGGRSYLAWNKVEARTEEFCMWLRDQSSCLVDGDAAAVYELSFEAHYRLVTIHPWSDGNGRMARLVMNIVQMEGGVIPSYVRSEARANYIASLRESQEARTSAPFHAFMAAEVIHNLLEEMRQYRASIKDDVPWADE